MSEVLGADVLSKQASFYIFGFFGLIGFIMGLSGFYKINNYMKLKRVHDHIEKKK